MLDRNRNAMVLRARALRREMTLPEALLWRELRLRPGGFKFRRQHPVEDFVVDLYCAAARLAVEIDGEAHGMGSNPQRDGERDQVLAGTGMHVLRIPARDVTTDLASVVTLVVRECRR